MGLLHKGGISSGTLDETKAKKKAQAGANARIPELTGRRSHAKQSFCLKSALYVRMRFSVPTILYAFL